MTVASTLPPSSHFHGPNDARVAQASRLALLGGVGEVLGGERVEQRCRADDEEEDADQAALGPGGESGPGGKVGQADHQVSDEPPVLALRFGTGVGQS